MAFYGRGSIQHPFATFLPVLTVSVVLGTLAYPITFFLSYIDSDPATWKNHLAFLILVAIYGAVCGLSVLLAAFWEPSVRTRELFAFGIQSAWSLNAFAVGIGSIVSATHKDENSVSSAFSTTTDVLVAAGLFGAAVLFAWRARRLTARNRG